jgi:hypothetical protein
MIRLPPARGPLTEMLLGEFARDVHELPRVPRPRPVDPLTDEDLHLALYLLYELHYRGLPGVDDRWEWEPSLLAIRAVLEGAFEDALRAAVPRDVAVPAPGEMDLALSDVSDADDAPALSRLLERDGTLEQYLEYLAHRSVYQLKEGDPHAFAISRLSGPPKAALVEILADEFGGGRPERVHAQLFADTLDALGLDAGYGAYLDRVPGVTLATVNLMSLFALHRRLRGAIIGQLALYETNSCVPMRRYGNGLRRLGVEDQRAFEFFDEHVEADAVHEAIAAVDLAGGLVASDPDAAPDVLWGARCALLVDGLWARRLADAWAAGRTSLLAPLPPPAPA